MTTLPASPTTYVDLLRRELTSAEHRGRRVCLMLAFVLIMCAADLYMTLTHLTHGGMMESNPLARLVISYNSSAILATWKILSTLLGVGILFRLRRSRAAEFGALAAMLVMGWLSVQWLAYSEQIEMANVETGPASILATDDPRWVSITEGT